MPNEGAAPGRDRIEAIDALRGLALMGILLANMLYWSGWLFMKPEQKVALAGVEQVDIEHFVHQFLIDGKFYTLFSLLFGMGFALQLQRLEKRGIDGVRIYYRRVLILLGFGLIHVTLIWDGDILTLYALLGLLLPLFRNWSERALAWAGVILLFLVPIVGATSFDALGWKPERYFYDLSDRITAGFGESPSDPIAWLRRGDPQAFFHWALSGWPYAIGTRIEGWRIPKVLGIMLIGLLLGRRLARGELLGDRKLLWRALIGGVALGVPFSLAYALIPNLGQDSLPSILGTAPLGFAYGAAFLLAWPRANSVLGKLAAPGRMALTNYLTHSLLGIILFYGIGFGLVGTLQPWQFYLVAVAIFAAQMVASQLYLARHTQGPMEALWRRLTYGRQTS